MLNSEPLVTIHAGPKRTASTQIQSQLLRFSDHDSLDGLSHDGNSHLLCLFIVWKLKNNNQNYNFSPAIKEDMLTNFNHENAGEIEFEIIRLKKRINNNKKIILSSELFSQLDPASLDYIFNLNDCINKRVVFCYRDTYSLLKSLYSNSVVSGYRGTAVDFIKDVYENSFCYFDLFPPILEWTNRNWEVKIVNYNRNDFSSYLANILSIITNSNYEKISILNNCNSEIENRSLKPDDLFKISLFSNAIYEHPYDLKEFNNYIKFINRVLLPFIRDTIYKPDDYDLDKIDIFPEILSKIDQKRKIHFVDYLY